MAQKHWEPSDFVIVLRSHGNAYGYCRKCTGDMQRLSGKLYHYNSHRNIKRI